VAEADASDGEAPPTPADVGDTAPEPLVAVTPDPDPAPVDEERVATDSQAPTVAEAPAPDAAAEPSVASGDEAPPSVSVSAGDEPAEMAAPPAVPPADPAAEARKRAELVARTDAVCARLEAMKAAATVTLRDADALLREARQLQTDSEHLPGRLIRRLKDGRAALFARTQELREAEEWRRWGNATAQEELCKRIEALVPREDLEAVARELKVLDQRWGEVKGVPKEDAEPLRQRYQAARAQIRPRLDAFFAQRAAAMAENRQKKEELAARAEALSGSTDWIKAAEELKALQAQWKQIGPVTRKEGEALWKRFRGACDTFFTRRKEDLRKRKTEWATHLARKLALCEQAEALGTSTDWDKGAAEIRRLQAEWKEIGAVRRDKSEEIWTRFRTACDVFFDRYKHRDQLERAERRAGREAALAGLEALLAPEAEAPEDLLARIQAAQAAARQAPVGGRDEEALAHRMAAVRDQLVARWPDLFRGSDLDPEASRARKEKLVARVEALASEAPAPTASLSGDELARRLKEALAARTIGGAGEAEARSRNAVEEVRSAQAAWSRLGPVPGDAGAALEERFRSACQRVLGPSGARPRSSPPAP
jgi:hypothetical protein